MKTSELLKRLDERGIRHINGETFIEIYHPNYGEEIAVRLNKNCNEMSFLGNYTYGYDGRSMWGDGLDFLTLINLYNKTPIEERKEEKKYYPRPKGMITLGGASFSYNPYGEYWYLENDPSTDHMTTFTIKELEDLGIDIEHYDLEEIE